MDIKQLDYFREIVESNFNLSKAANKLHVSQPSLSMMINNWENQYGIKLFVKKNSRYHALTKEGEYIYNHAIQVLKLHNDFLYSLEEIKRGFSGSVRLGIPSYILTLLFNKPIVNFISSYSDINLSIIEDGALELEKKLQQSEIDMAILLDESLKDTFNVKPLFKDNFVVAINKTLVTSRNTEITLEELQPLNLITFTDNFSIYHNIIDIFKDKFLHPNIAFRAGQWDIILDIVNNTKCYSIIPESLADQVTQNNVVIKKIQGLTTTWDIILATDKNKIKTPSLKFLEEYMLNYFSKYEPISRTGKKAINVK